MIILALDASTSAVGWCVAENAQIENAGVYVPKDKDWVERVYMIGEFVRRTLWDYDPDYLAYEVAMGNRGNMATHRKLGAVEYVIRLSCSFQGSELIEINPQEIKATGVSKENPVVGLQAVLRDLPRFDPPPDAYMGDLADAVGCYLVALAKLRKEGHYD